jgi:predicted hotdog family 3-hydroxylacyl-ACP dehydratase
VNREALPQPASVLPHRHDAVLLDEIVGIGADRLEASLTVRPDSAFSDEAGNLPGWIGPEIMAEAVAALAGHRSLAARGRPAEIGLLLGIRNYECAVDEFRVGDRLTVAVTQSWDDEEGHAVFDCVLAGAGRTLATAILNVFQPIDGTFVARECARDD